MQKVLKNYDNLGNSKVYFVLAVFQQNRNLYESCPSNCRHISVTTRFPTMNETVIYSLLCHLSCRDFTSHVSHNDNHMLCL